MMRALVLLSGGLDSTVCLFHALKHYNNVEALTIDYMQKHFHELECAAKVAELAGVRHQYRRLEVIKMLCPSSITRLDQPVTDAQSTVSTLRNMFMISAASVIAIQSNISHIVFGACGDDQLNYPDCRPQFFDALEQAIRIGSPPGISIHTPLIGLSKAQIIKYAKSLGDDCWNALKDTWTCYEAHPNRSGCGVCPSCCIRAKGFAEAGWKDPIT
jgi:7-cyano-7-deazaguanine synthase